MLEEICKLPSPDDIEALRSKKRRDALDYATRHIKDCMETQYDDPYILVNKNNLTCPMYRTVKEETLASIVAMLRFKGWRVEDSNNMLEIYPPKRS